jgi:hypothetical protein
MVAIFSLLGAFAFWGMIVWVGVLLVLLLADAAWTHGLATSYINATQLILSQIWSGLQLFFTFLQRLVAMAPRVLQIVLFMMLGVFAMGLIINWFLAVDIVCSNDQVYRGASLISVWFAKMYSGGEDTTAHAQIAISRQAEMWFPKGSEFTVNGEPCAMATVEPNVMRGSCLRAECTLTDLLNGTMFARCEGNVSAEMDLRASTTNSVSTINAGTQTSTAFGRFLVTIGYPRSWMWSGWLDSRPETTTSTDVISTTATGSSYVSSASGIVQNQATGINEGEKAAYFADLLSKASPSRQTFIDSANAETQNAFVPVELNGDSAITYTCGSMNEIQVGLWGQEDFFSMKTMFFILCFVCAIGIVLYVRSLVR